MKKHLILSFLAVAVFACNTDQTTEATDDIEIVAEVEEAEKPIALNDGEKWLVNDEMKPFLELGENLLANYIENGETDYKNLAASLKDQNDQLIKSCTMKGQSHDELHKWLHPHLEMVKSLSETEDEATANQLVADLSNSYQLYKEYFQ